VVLEPKLSILDLQIQHTADQLFMKRAIGYCIQAFNRIKMGLIIVIIYVSILDSYVGQHTMANRFPCGHDFPSESWAIDCITLSKDSLGEGNTDTSLNLMFALGLFFTNHALFADDPTMQYLYTLTLNGEEDHHKDIMSLLLESKDRAYERLLSLS
jgi:hypothetical protein